MNSHLESLSDLLRATIAGIAPEQLSHCGAGKWCAADILEHLYLTYTGTVRGIERVEQAGKPLASHSSLTKRMQAFVVIGLGYFPKGRKSPRVAEPRGLPREQVMGDIVSKIAQMDSAISRCEAKFGPHTKILDHPFLGALSAEQWAKFHFVHGNHHLRQIERLLRKNPQ